MKFIVRDGFVVHHTKFAKIKQGNQTINQPQTDSYYAGEEVDFDEATASEHAHKLQAVCKQAHAYADGLVLPTAATNAGLSNASAAA